MYRVDLTEDQARRLHASSSFAHTFAILLEAAGTDRVLRYLTQSAPRPPLQVTLPAGFKEEALQVHTGIELGVDGDHAFALLGTDIQSGESEFVKLATNDVNGELVSAKQALRKLRERLGTIDAPYYFGKSHPYGGA